MFLEDVRGWLFQGGTQKGVPRLEEGEEGLGLLLVSREGKNELLLIVCPKEIIRFHLPSTSYLGAVVPVATILSCPSNQQ